MPHPGRMTTQKAKDFKGTMRSLLAELGHYKFRLIAVIVFAVLSTIFNIAGPKVLAKATTALATGWVAKLRGTGSIDFGYIGKILLILLVVLSAAAIAVGSAGYSVGEILRALLSTEKSTVKVIVMNLRLPRLLLAVMIGASLSASGALLQSVMRNPLADPGTIGVSAGAGTAATTILLLFPHMTNAAPLFAFGGAALACCLIYSLAWKGGIDPVRIILSGVAINSVLGAYIALLQLLYSDSLQGVLAFMNGSLSGRSWSQVQTLVIYAGIGLALAFLCIKSANTLQLGDEMAKSLGVRVNASRLFLSAVSAFLAAATVSVAGMIGFVGLVVPHISRLLVGSDYKAMLPTSVLLGAGRIKKEDSIDFAAGITMHKKLGDYVKAGESICTFYADDESLFDAAEEMYRGGLIIRAEKPTVPPLIYARVTADGVERF